MRNPLYTEAAPITAEQHSMPTQEVEHVRACSAGCHLEVDLLTDLADAEDRGQWTRAAQLRMWILSGRLHRPLPHPSR